MARSSHQTFASVHEKSVLRKTIEASERETASTGRSRVSFAEYRRYADHLHTTGQGITNPGSFALTIFRSGISDAFVEKFLHPKVEAAFDAGTCETCKGTGFYCPHGAESGLAKCWHEGMKTRARRRLKPEQIIEQAEIIGELLESRYTMEQAETQFAEGLDHTELRTKVRLAVTVNYRKHDGSSEILSHFVLQPGIRMTGK